VALTHRRSDPHGGRGASKSGSDTTTTRQWAREKGHQVSERGRIPKSVVDTYQAAT